LSLPKYHIYIEYTEQEKSGIRFNIGTEELNRTFVEPFNAGQQFWFMGRLLNPIKVNKVLLFWSYEAADKLKLPNGENLVVAKDKKFLIDCIQKGKVKGAYICTEKFLPQIINVSAQSAGSVNRRVFVISGTDEEMKQAVTKALTKLGLAPIVLCEDPGHCRKIVEQTPEYADANFAVAILSPDDYVYAKTGEPSKRRLKPQLDVVFELGFMLGKLGKDRVMVLFREVDDFEVPSSFGGLKVTAFDDRGSWKLALLRELSKNGYNVDSEKIIK
jgi:predicted nucleotide-binding protein